MYALDRASAAARPHRSTHFVYTVSTAAQTATAAAPITIASAIGSATRAEFET